MPNENYQRGWVGKFKDAFGGIADGVNGQSSFFVHIPFSIAVIVCAAIFKATILEWTSLIICITLVLALELFNSSLELIAKAITNDFDESIRRSLNIASGAVLVGAIGSATVGITILLNRFLIFISQVN